MGATVATGFAAPLIVRVHDLHDNPVAGATVSFASPVGGATATVSAATATTDALGHASVVATAGTVAGSYQVEAAIAAGTTSFALGNRPGAAAQLVLIAGGGQATEVGVAFAAPIVVQLEDAFANPIPDAAIAVAAPADGARATRCATCR